METQCAILHSLRIILTTNNFLLLTYFYIIISLHIYSRYTFLYHEEEKLRTMTMMNKALEQVKIMMYNEGCKPDMSRSEESESGNKVVIVDYDDTILPSTFVDRWQIDNSKDLPEQFQNILGELSRVAELFLSEASKYGQVIIITNSDEGWVEYSAERYCPSLLPVISKYPVISARTRYEKFYPCQPLCWKAAAFAHEVNEIYSSIKNNTNKNKPLFSITVAGDDATSCASMEETEVSSTSSLSDTSMGEDDQTMENATAANDMGNKKQQRQIISFGDSNEERLAVSIVSGQLDAVPKSIKFMPSPSLLQIIGQLHLLTKHMQFVCESTKSLDMHITEEQADQYAKTFLQEKRIYYDNNIIPSYVPRNKQGLCVYN